MLHGPKLDLKNLKIPMLNIHERSFLARLNKVQAELLLKFLVKVFKIL